MDGTGWFLKTGFSEVKEFVFTMQCQYVLKRKEDVEQQQIDVNTAVIRNVKFDFVMHVWSKMFLTELNVSR